MIIVNDKPLYSTQAVIAAASRVWPAGEHFGRVLDLIEDHPALGVEVRAVNMTHEAETRFVDVDMLAVVLGWPAGRLEDVKGILRIQRQYPDDITGYAVSISRREQGRIRNERRKAFERFETLAPAQKIWISRGRQNDEVVRIDLGPTIRDRNVAIRI